MIRWLVRIGALYVAYKFGEEVGRAQARVELGRQPPLNYERFPSDRKRVRRPIVDVIRMSARSRWSSRLIDACWDGRDSLGSDGERLDAHLSLADWLAATLIDQVNACRPVSYGGVLFA